MEFNGGVWFCQQPDIGYCKVENKLISAYVKGNYISKRIIYVSACTWLPVRIMQLILGATIHLIISDLLTSVCLFPSQGFLNSSCRVTYRGNIQRKAIEILMNSLYYS